VLTGFLCLLVLLTGLFVARSGAQGAEGVADASFGRRRVAAGAFVVLLGALPLFWALPWLHGAVETYIGDGLSHAALGQAVAEHGLPHGWVDLNLGGFPFGHHYPPLGTLVLALTMRLGVSPAMAIQLWGVAATLSVPVAFYFCGTLARVRPSYAALGALYVSWVSPYNPFVGGYEAFFHIGLFSQVLALPLCIAFAGSIASGTGRWSAPLGALAMSGHPQLGIATLAVTACAVAASASRAAAARFARGAAGAAIFGVALYGQGALHVEVPFGWPPALGWRQVGFDSSRLAWWYVDGDLLDAGRSVLVLTALGAAAAVALTLSIARPAARAALAAALAAVVLSVTGRTLARFEPVGPALLSVLQPMRVLALIPPLAAALVVVALEVSEPKLRAALGAFRPRFERAAPWLGFAVAALLVAGALPGRVHYASRVAGELEARRGGRCASAPPGYDAGEIRRWLAKLRGGRLWFDEHSGDDLQKCLVTDGVSMASSVPLGATVGVGAHVGVLWLAFQRVEPQRGGSERRAEAVGVRYALGHPIGSPAWQTLERRGGVELAAHRGPTDAIGVGCITRAWRGSDRALRSHLFEVLRTAEGADRLLDPNRFVELRHDDARAVVETEVGEGACAFDGARVAATAREPGALEAVVESSAPVDVVLRVAAFPTWAISVDGAPAKRSSLVAPGFPSVRVPAGRHRVVAVAGSLPGYAALVALGAFAVLALSLVRAEHVRRARAFLTRLRGAGAPVRET
jgi:hypothetical protein